MQCSLHTLYRRFTPMLAYRFVPRVIESSMNFTFPRYLFFVLCLTISASSAPQSSTGLSSTGNRLERSLSLSLQFNVSLYSFPRRISVSLHYSPLANFGWNTFRSSHAISQECYPLYPGYFSHTAFNGWSSRTPMLRTYTTDSDTRNGAPQQLVSQETGAPI